MPHSSRGGAGAPHRQPLLDDDPESGGTFWASRPGRRDGSDAEGGNRTAMSKVTSQADLAGPQGAAQASPFAAAACGIGGQQASQRAGKAAGKPTCADGTKPRGKSGKKSGGGGAIPKPPKRLSLKRQPGMTQGIDVKRRHHPTFHQLSHNLKAPVKITVVDYDAEQIKVHPPLQNADLAAFLDASRPAFSRVRWINLQGLSWDCILALAIKFDLHPLSVEDCVHVPQRIKVDIHSADSIFCCLTLASIVLEQQQPQQRQQQQGFHHHARPSGDSAAHASHHHPPASLYRGSMSGAPHTHAPGRADHAPGGAVHEGGLTGQSTIAGAAGMGGDNGGVGGAEGFHGHYFSAVASAVPLRRLSSVRVRGTMEPLPVFVGEPLPGGGDVGEDSTTSLSGKEDDPPSPSASFIHCASNTTSYRPLRKRTTPIPGTTQTNIASTSSTPSLGGPPLPPNHIPKPQATGGAGGWAQSAPDGGGAITSLEIAAEQVYIFLQRDGTVISMFEQDGSGVSRPILQQLLEERTLARESEDASYLLNLLIDAIVDVAYPLVDAYTERLHIYEDRVLLGQQAASFTRDLHVMRGDLASLRRTILPTSSLVATLQGHSDMDAAPLVSRLTRTYLGDVQDHLSTILEEMEGLQSQCQALADLVFNLIAHNQNKAMQTLSVMSTVFLPITFLAGVYGTNFEYLPELHWEYGYVYFWAMCCALAITFLLLLWRLGVITTN